MGGFGLGAAGHLALAFAFVLAAVQALAGGLGLWRRNAALVALASQAAVASFVVILSLIHI